MSEKKKSLAKSSVKKSEPSKCNQKCNHCKKNYIIDSVHLSLPVKFEKQNELFLSTRDINGKKGKKISINYDIQMIEIESDIDHILIPLASVRGIYLLSKLKRDQIKKSEEQVYGKKE